MFEKATKQKLRFKIPQGFITTEDLWDLSLESLDTLAKNLKKELRDSEDESFIKKKTSANTTLDLKFNVVLHVIEVKMVEADARKQAVEKAAKKAQLIELINQKELEGLASKSLDDLKKELESY